MILENTIGYSYNDITIIPNVTSKVQSRKLVDPFDNTYVPAKKCPNKKMLPIFTAPMSCVLDDVNYELFEANHIYTVIPTTVVNAQRHVMFFAGGRFVSFSLDEAHDLILNEVYKKGFLKNHTYKLCIDCANGHMDRLLFICDRIKEFAKERGCEIEIMTGNIANPNTWLEYNKHKIDYVRVGIGGGSGCTTTSNVSVHYPMATLLNNIKKLKENLKSQNKDFVVHTKIIADGGIRNYSDVIKALALGADYIMIGGLFTKCLEAASTEYTIGKETNTNKEKYIETGLTINKYSNKEQEKRDYINKYKLFHEVYGMSTKRVQKMRGNEELKTSEGTQHFTPILYTLKQWSENMESYLRSVMSYTECFTLEQFKNEVDLIINSNNAVNSVNK